MPSFTAIFEPQGDGSVVALVAEWPEVSTRAGTVEEARRRLLVALKQALESRRAEALAGMTAQARVEPLPLSLAPLTGLDPEAQTESAGDEWAPIWQTLLEQGRIDHIPTPLPPGSRREEHDPIAVEGKPISQEIIEGRR